MNKIFPIKNCKFSFKIAMDHGEIIKVKPDLTGYDVFAHNLVWNIYSEFVYVLNYNYWRQ